MGEMASQDCFFLLLSDATDHPFLAEESVWQSSLNGMEQFLRVMLSLFCLEYQPSWR